MANPGTKDNKPVSKKRIRYNSDMLGSSYEVDRSGTATIVTSPLSRGVASRINVSPNVRRLGINAPGRRRTAVGAR